MANIHDVIKLDSVEEMEIFLQKHSKVIFAQLHYNIVRSDLDNLFAHYVAPTKTMIKRMEKDKEPKIYQYMIENGLDGQTCNPTPPDGITYTLLTTGTLEQLKAVKADRNERICEETFLYNPHADAVRYCYETFHNRKNASWESVARHSTPEVAAIYYEIHGTLPTKKDILTAMEGGNLSTYRYMCKLSGQVPVRSKRMLLACCLKGEESDIREYWAFTKNIMGCVRCLWARHMYALVKELLAGWRPTIKLMKKMRWSDIRIAYGIMYMGWRNLIYDDNFYWNLRQIAEIHGYWPWFAHHSRKIGIFHRKNDILKPT